MRLTGPRALLAILAALAAAAAGLLAPSSASAALVGFQTPSGNVGCLVTRGTVRCDILDTTNRLPRRPASCELSYGRAFSVGPRGRAVRLCVGDTVVDSSSRVLAYGRSLRVGGVTCVSRKDGLRCTNRNAHGFQLSRAVQRVF